MKPQFLAVYAQTAFGATHTGVSPHNIWADFKDQAAKETFALHCLLEGFGVLYSAQFPERNRVLVNVDYNT